LIDLTMLHIDAPGVTNHQAHVMAEQAEVCMAHNNHAPGVSCVVKQAVDSNLLVSWNTSEDQDRLKAGHADLQEATEGGATGVAIAYMKHAHDLVVISRSPKDGNGFDYFMAPRGSGTILRSKPTALLEVSGVLENGDVECRARLKEKAKQVKKGYSSGMGAFAVVVGFKRPSIWLESV
jgi:hypothetical protein